MAPPTTPPTTPPTPMSEYAAGPGHGGLATLDRGQAYGTPQTPLPTSQPQASTPYSIRNPIDLARTQLDEYGDLELDLKAGRTVQTSGGVRLQPKDLPMIMETVRRLKEITLDPSRDNLMTTDPGDIHNVLQRFKGRK